MKHIKRSSLALGVMGLLLLIGLAVTAYLFVGLL